MVDSPPVLFDWRYEPSDRKGKPGGYAPLSETSVVPTVHLPEATSQTPGVIRLAGALGGTAESPSIPALSGVDFADFELQSNKNLANGYAGLNSVSRITKGSDTTDDIVIDSSAKGVVFKDAVTAHYIRLTLSAGVLSLADLGTTKP